jgi:hypothetical protein
MIAIYIIIGVILIAWIVTKLKMITEEHLGKRAIERKHDLALGLQESYVLDTGESAHSKRTYKYVGIMLMQMGYDLKKVYSETE